MGKAMVERFTAEGANVVTMARTVPDENARVTGDVLPYFRRSETRSVGNDDYRGGDGPMRVQPGCDSQSVAPGLSRGRPSSRSSPYQRLQRPPAGRGGSF